MSKIYVDSIASKTGASDALSIDSSGFATTTKSSVFRAYRSSTQSIADATQTVVEFDTLDFDPNGWYSTSTYRFTPTVAGYYYIYSQYRWNTTTDFDISDITIQKNGSKVLDASDANHRYDTMQIGGVLYFNGSTDYAQVVAYQDSTGSKDIRGNAPETYFTGFRIVG